MNFDFGDVLTRAWKITWKDKVLWIISIVFGLSVSVIFPLMFAPALFPLVMQNSRMDMSSVSAYVIGFIILAVLSLAGLYLISVLAQSSLTLGVLNANREDHETLSARDLIKKSLPFFWRVLGLMVLFAAGMGLINLVISAIVLVLTIVTMGIATICMMPLTLLMYPVIYGFIVWMEQSMNAIIIDDMTVIQAAKYGWHLLRSNLGSMTLMALVIYFGVGLVTGILIMPIMAPFFVLPFGFIENQTNWTILSIAILWTVAFIPLFGVVTGLSMLFTKSAWVLTYLRLTRSSTSQRLLASAEATA